MVRSSRNGVPGSQDCHEDYAYVIQALLALSRVVENQAHLDDAILVEKAELDFWDTAGGFYFTRGEDVISRRKAIRDSAIPSPNAVSMMNPLDLVRTTGDSSFLDRIDLTLKRFAHPMKRSSSTLARMVVAADSYQHHLKEEASPVSVSVHSATAEESTWRVSVDLNIDDGWHIQAHGAPAPYHPATFVSEDRVDVIRMEFRDPDVLDTDFTETSLPVYSGVNRVNLLVAIPSGAGRHKVGFEYQACGEFKCLPPTKLVLDLDLATIPAEEIIAGKNGKSSRTP